MVVPATASVSSLDGRKARRIVQQKLKLGQGVVIGLCFGYGLLA